MTAAQGDNSGRQAGAGPLAGVVVIDMTHALAGPFATMLLGDLGATVYKIERPGRGDQARHLPPFVGEMAVGFAASNRNKHSIAIDVGTSEGRQLILRLVERADALIHNYRPGVMERLGLDEQALRAAKPDLVFAAISGYGQGGPYRDRAAFDPTIQAMAGVSAITGSPGAPAPAGIAVGDLVAPLFTVIATLAALYEVRQSGRGRSIDVSMFDALFNLHAHRMAIYDAIGKVPPPSGDRRPEAFPMGTFPTNDGFVVLAALNERFWLNLCDALGHPEWNEPDRFGSMRARSKKRTELYEAIRRVLSERSTAEWTETFVKHDVPCGAVADYPTLVDSELVDARRLLASVKLSGEDGDEHRVRVPARPVKYSDFDPGVRLDPPRLGEHTRTVLAAELSLDDAEIDRLVAARVLEVAP